METKKAELFNSMKEFLDSEDLMSLSDVVIVANQILKDNNFPFKYYKEWKLKNVVE